MLHVTVPDKLLPPLISRFRDIHFKPYTEEEFVEIVVNVLDREEGVDRDIALLIADGVYNRLKSSNISKMNNRHGFLREATQSFSIKPKNNFY